MATKVLTAIRTGGQPVEMQKPATVTVRVLYATGKRDAIVVFHAFLKKSQKTPMREINIGRRRLQEVWDAKIES